MVLKGGWGVSFLSALCVELCLMPPPSHSPLGTTFKGKYGCVDYWVKALLERPSFPTQQVKKRFEVMDPVDVNTPELLVGLHCLHPPPFSSSFLSCGAGGGQGDPCQRGSVNGLCWDEALSW